MIHPIPTVFDYKSLKTLWNSNFLQSEVEDIGDFMACNPLLNEILVLHDSAVAILDMRTMQYPLILGNVEKVCGWSKEKFLCGGIEAYMACIPPAEHTGLGEINKLMAQFILGLPKAQSSKFSALYDYAMTRSDGTICRIIQENSVLKRDSRGNILFSLALISNITSLKRDDRRHLRLTHELGSQMYEVDNRTGGYRLLKALSKREVEIARLLGQNLDSKAISKLLFISAHTVNTHRQNMLRRFGMADTMELISLLTTYRLL